MPTPQENEPRDQFIQRCIPQVINEGTARNTAQAYAICINMYDQGKKDQDKPIKEKNNG
jgi:hypothetical protein